MNRIPSKSAGFSLIEVLVAVVIMTIGLLALASLQLSLIRTSGQTKAQTVAMGIAKETIEADRAFTDYAGYQAIVSSGPTTTSIGGVDYVVTKTVTRYVYDNDATTPQFVTYTANASLAALTADTAIDYLSGRDFKKESVKVTWSDAAGAAATGINTVTLDDAIDWLDPADTARLAKKSSSTSARTAEIIISDPSSEAGVIPIAIGDAKDTAATNPRPVINSSGTETRFDILTYAALSGGTALAQSRVETNVVGCTCDTSTKPTDPDERGYRPTYFNGVRYVAPTLTSYVPPAGQYAATSDDESPYCSECCRDHHDPSSVVSAKKPLFDPWRTSHDHYYRDGSGNLQKVDSTNTHYSEACRLIRVDGIFRVAADFNDEYFNLLETKNDGSSDEYVPSDTAADYYVAMVLDYLDKKVISTDDTATDPAVSVYNHEVSDTDVAGFETDNHINDPASLPIERTNDHKWLHSRGLYVDYLETEALEKIASAKSDCEDISCTDDELQVAVLSVLPFTSINVSELSIWTPLVSDKGMLSVTSDAFYTQSGTDPVRGKTVPNTTYIPSGPQESTAYASMRKSNSALAAISLAIDKDEDGLDNTSGNPTTTESDTDGQLFAIGTGTGSSSGTFTVKPSGYGNNDPSFTGDYVSNCTSAKVSGKTVYTCSSNKIGVADTIKISGYNYQSANTSKVTAGTAITCTKSDGTAPLASTIVNSDPKLYTCNNYQVSSVTVTPAGATIGGLTVTNSGLTTESTSVLITPINQSDELTVTFATDTPSYGYTCTYTSAISDRVVLAATCK
jgi:type IV pilus modification protein PilV